MMTIFAVLAIIIMAPVLLGYSIFLIALVIAAAIAWIVGCPIRVKENGRVLGYVKRGKFHKL
jgi:hypothetical protein